LQLQKRQAALFLEKFSPYLEKKDLNLLVAFSRFRESNLVTKFYLMTRYRFYKQGLLRNLRDLSFS